MDFQEKLQKLNELVQVSEDAEKGFRLAAIEVREPQFKNLFRLTAQERAAFALQLKEELRKIGAEPVKEGSRKGSLHRAWMKLRSRLNPRNDRAVIAECARGEEAAMKVYTDIFENKLLTEMEQTLHEQFVNIIEMRDWLKLGKTNEGVWSGRMLNL